MRGIWLWLAFNSSLVLMALLTACAQRPDSEYSLPSLPAEYYECSEAAPRDLVYAYYSKYMTTAEAQARYDGVIFVLKNLTVDKTTFKFKADGCIYVDQIKCMVPGIRSDARYFHEGDKIDIVGKNEGTAWEQPGLAFSNCYVLPAGAIELPAPGTAGQIVMGY